MKSSTRFASIGIAVLALAVGLGGIAVASGSNSDPAIDSHATTHSSGAVTPHYVPGSISLNQFVPITPCRLADTRHATAGALVAGTTRNLFVAGVSGNANFAGQGGNSNGCGIPNGANAIAAGITATASKGTGYLHAWQAYQSEPAATVLNYTDLGVGGITVNAPIPVLGAAGFYGLALKAYGAKTDVVVDVYGYYIEPIEASINADGSIHYSSSQLLSSQATATGSYKLVFNQTVAGCSIQGTAGESRDNIGLSASGSTVSLFVRDEAVSPSVLENQDFTISVTC